nr:unnamed protein product [Callosobruchus analis]
MNVKNSFDFLVLVTFFLHHLKLFILFLQLYSMKIMTYRNLINLKNPEMFECLGSMVLKWGILITMQMWPPPRSSPKAVGVISQSPSLTAKSAQHQQELQGESVTRTMARLIITCDGGAVKL